MYSDAYCAKVWITSCLGINGFTNQGIKDGFEDWSNLQMYKMEPPVMTNLGISSVERDMETGEVNEVRGAPGWERVRVPIDSGAIDTMGPTEVAKALR